MHEIGNMYGHKMNPYASPATAGTGPQGKRELAFREGITARAIFGLWAGVLFGGTFGAMGSVLLGLSQATLLGWVSAGPQWQTVEQFLLTEIVAAIAGAICGLVAGACIGPLVALTTSLGASRRHPGPVIGSAMALSAVAGASLGALGGWLLSPVSSHPGWLIGLGGAIGSVAGLLGGLQLGRGIIDFSLGDSPAPPPDEDPRECH